MATNVAQDRLGDLFVREGLITEPQLQQGLAEGKKEGTRLGFALVKLGFVAEDELTRMLSNAVSRARGGPREGDLDRSQDHQDHHPGRRL